MNPLVVASPTALWEIHLRIPTEGPVAIACKHGGERVTDGVLRPPTPTAALRTLELLLERFQGGDQLFITARTHDSSLSMWRTGSKAAGLYWCASALAKLWRCHESGEREVEPDLLSRVSSRY